MLHSLTLSVLGNPTLGQSFSIFSQEWNKKSLVVEVPALLSLDEL